MTEIFISPNNEYPRHIGDIYLDVPSFSGNIDNLPEGWKAVISTTPPETLENEIFFEIYPVLIDDVYRQAWDIRPMTEEEAKAIAG